MPVNFFSKHLTQVILCLFFFLPQAAEDCQGKTTGFENFPSYKSIHSNVLFWEKIYSHYSLTEAVIDDSKDLSKIYDVIPLLGPDLPGAARINSLFQQHAINKYREILKNISDQKPVTADEKRVAALFPQKNRHIALALATENVRSQRGQKERFLAGVIDSGRYMKEIKRILQAHNLPEELAYLPHVESSFNFLAYSKFGAAGIWQFTRATGEQYLTIDYTLDERLDPILATHAAVKYLKKSYTTLNNWPLALTSYNYGLAGMVRAVNEQGNYEKIFLHYNKGHFKFASRNFYSEFLAALKIAQQLEEKHKAQIQPAQSSRYLNLPGYVDITEIRRHFGISTETIKALNPALRASVVLGEKHIPKGYTLRLPAEKKTNRLLASLPSTFYKKEQKATLFHRVQKGETAGSIAQLHGVPLKKLMKANNLNKYATIYLQQRLRIPKQPGAARNSQQNILKITARNKAKILNSGHDSTPPVLVARKKQHPSGNGYDYLPIKDPNVYNVFKIYPKNGKTYGYITVQPEESLALYEDWLGSGSAIATLNKLSPDAHVTPGQQLLLVFDRITPTHFEEKRLDFLQATEEDFFSAFTVIGQQIYQVLSGDTLWDLCYNKFDIPLWLLERYNSAISLTQLNQEQELIIPIVQQI
jgi:membrane-bound lytic murein transglycosylase D